MTKDKFRKLKVGDPCAVLRGYDEGRVCYVRFIGGDVVLIETIDGDPFKSETGHGKFRLTNWKELISFY